MKFLIKKTDAVNFDEHGISIFHEYQFSFKGASLGVSEILARYPQTGFDVDEEVDAYWYVEKGEAKIFVGGQVHEASEGDMLFIPKGEKFYIDTQYVKLVVCSTPLWSPEQHKHIEE